MAMLGEGMQARPDDPVVVVTDNPQPVAAAVGNATACDLEINPCAMRLWLLVAAGFTATVLSASLAFDWWDGLGDYGTTLGYAGVVVFGLMTCRLIWMLPAERGPAVIVTPYGIRDLRIGNEFLLWDSIAAISVDGGPGRKAIVLTLTAALQRQRCTTCAKSRAAPTDRIVIRMEGLATDFDTVLRACRDFHAASNPGTALQQEDERGTQNRTQGFAVQAS